MFKRDNVLDINIKNYNLDAKDHAYVEKLSQIESTDAKQFLDVGIDIDENARIGTFIQKDKSVIHCKTRQDGVEVMSISQAREKHAWLSDYMWKNISPDTDKFILQAKKNSHEGYFIHALAGVKAKDPIQSCLYIAEEGFSQNVHNIVVAEQGSELHIITGCATAPHLKSGLHIGVSEFYVKRGAKLTFTMIHDWGEKINVRPRTVIRVEEGGTIISNYISLKPVGSLQMFPTTYLNGKGAVLNAPDTRAEIISRGISSGGSIIARGELVGKVSGIKAHLECHGLILNDGLMQAIPEIIGYVPGVEMSHEAAVGKIDQREIEYLMARGLDEEEAISTIVRGFLNVNIEGLPADLKKRLDETISETQKEMM
ncbi:MAG: SufD family Fe-S cluster assembly protein [Deltaproteobacteria bacterium]|nr:SufD family Fe-S cluster assembly protein [Deltaproteobacteria bacterium]